jgi:TonB family protein
MTLTIKNSLESNSPGKPGTSSQNSETSAGQSPRSNPVCLEVGVTIRSLPAEAGSQAQPFREEGRTVIVFDNGAVLRSANSLPMGQTFILSNPKGRDVVCRVVSGRNLPSVKGYAEVEFVEPVKDFWSIHQDAGPVSVAPPAPVIPREPVAPPAPPPIPRAAIPLDTPAKPGSVVLGGGPSFDDIPGLVSKPVLPVTRESKAPSTRLGPERLPKVDSDYNLSGIAEPTSVANWRPPDSELPPEKRAIAAMREALSTATPIPVSKPPRDFMGKGLTAYEQPRSSSASSTTIGRGPLILGAATLVLAGIGAVIFYLHQGTTPASALKADIASQPSAPEPPALRSAPQHESAPVAAQTKPQAQQSAALNQVQPAASVAAVPAVVTNADTPNSRTESGNVRRQGENAAAAKQANLASTRRPAIPNLKIGSPTAPNQTLPKAGEDAAPLTDIASTEAVGGTPSAGLLTSAGRTSNPPAPPVALEPAPPPAPAVKVVRDPKLVSSVRPVYPTAAKASNIQGTVAVTANIDATGKVVAVRALSGPMLLRQAAEDAVKLWKYSPGTVDGKPAPSHVTLNVDFRLN